MAPPSEGLCMADMAEGVFAFVGVYLFSLAKTRGCAGTGTDSCRGKMV